MSEREAPKWPREIWAAETEDGDPLGTHVFSVHATVARWPSDYEREAEYHRYVDGDVLDTAERYYRERIEQMQAAMGEREVTVPDYIYDPEDWEYTWSYSERRDLVDDWPNAGPAIGHVRSFATLLKGPRTFAAHVVLTRDDDGDPDETEIQWFTDEADARRALAGDDQ